MLEGAPPSSYMLHGRVVLGDGSAADRYLLIRDGVVESVTRHRVPIEPSTIEVEIEREAWIFPGLIDLHSHADYNILPLWDAPGAPYHNRFVWRRSEDYAREVRGVYQTVLEAASRPPVVSGASRSRLLALFAELQTIAGGTTTLQESWAIEAEIEGLEHLLVRSTAHAREIGHEGREVLSVVDFFAPDAFGVPAPKRVSADGATTWPEVYAHARDEGRLVAALVHLAEGRSGFGSEAGPDPYTRAEMEAFMALPSMQDAARVRGTPFAIIHGSGIDTEDPRHLAFLRARDIAVVWSPVSNLLLYGDTLDVGRLLDAGVRVVLGSDWSPSGSKHVWDELKMARFVAEAADFAISDAQLFEMVSSAPARSLGQPRLGAITSGSFADLFIVRSPVATDAPYEALLRSSDRHVKAVFVGGWPLYGERSLMEKLTTDVQPLPSREGSAVADKVVHLPAALTHEDGSAIQLGPDIDALEDVMKAIAPPVGPVLRSNLLADADAPYRDRVVELRRAALLWAERVRRGRRRQRTAKCEGTSET